MILPMLLLFVQVAAAPDPLLARLQGRWQGSGTVLEIVDRVLSRDGTWRTFGRVTAKRVQSGLMNR
jgi:hypothetical protein